MSVWAAEFLALHTAGLGITSVKGWFNKPSPQLKVPTRSFANEQRDQLLQTIHSRKSVAHPERQGATYELLENLDRSTKLLFRLTQYHWRNGECEEQ